MFRNLNNSGWLPFQILPVLEQAARELEQAARELEQGAWELEQVARELR